MSNNDPPAVEPATDEQIAVAFGSLDPRIHALIARIRLEQSGYAALMHRFQGLQRLLNEAGYSVQFSEGKPWLHPDLPEEAEVSRLRQSNHQLQHDLSEQIHQVRAYDGLTRELRGKLRECGSHSVRCGAVCPAVPEPKPVAYRCDCGLTQAITGS